MRRTKLRTKVKKGNKKITIKKELKDYYKKKVRAARNVQLHRDLPLF